MAPLIRPGHRLATLGLLVAALALPVRAEHRETPTEWQVKAAFLFNFVGFVEWPEGAVPEDRFVIGVLAFGLVSWGNWANLGSNTQPFVDIDTNNDGRPEFETFATKLTGSGAKSSPS